MRKKRNSQVKTQRFKDLMYPYYGDLYRFAFARLGNETDAEDVVQETYLKAFRAFDSFKDDSGPKSWLSCILINTIRDHVRKVSKTPKTVSMETSHQAEVSEAHSDRMHLMDPAVRAARNEVDADLMAALKELPDTFLSPLLLREIHDATYQVIASTLDIPIGTVMSRLSRARNLLRDKLISQKSDPAKPTGFKSHTNISQSNE